MEITKNIWRVNRDKLFLKFSDSVLKGIYKKAPYSDWRKLMSDKSEYVKIVQKIVAPANVQYTIYASNGEELHTCNSSDRSLGAYIYSHWQSPYRELEKLADSISNWVVDRNKLLDAFTERIQAGFYERVDYGEWRKIAHNDTKYFVIKKTSLPQGYSFALFGEFSADPSGVIDWGSPIAVFPCIDKSFGQFLSHAWKHEAFSLELPFGQGEEAMYDKIGLSDTTISKTAQDYVTGRLAVDTSTAVMTSGTNYMGGDTVVVKPGDTVWFNGTTTNSHYAYDNHLESAITSGVCKKTDINPDDIIDKVVNKIKPDDIIDKVVNKIKPDDIIDKVVNKIKPDDIVNKVVNKIEEDNKKEKKNMKTNDLFNFEFGPVSGDQFRMSPYGIAVATPFNGWVSYNAKTGEIFDVDVINFDISKMIFKMPVALNAIAVGDILIHSGKPVFVRTINGDGTVGVIDYSNATVTNILPVKSPFGFNFFTKICALIDFNGATASETNPFGNMLPFLMLAGNKDGEFDPTMLMMANAMGGINGTAGLFENPMMLYLMMSGKDKDKSDMLPFLLMGMGAGGLAGVTSAPDLPATAGTAPTANPVGV